MTGTVLSHASLLPGVGTARGTRMNLAEIRGPPPEIAPNCACTCAESKSSILNALRRARRKVMQTPLIFTRPRPYDVLQMNRFFVGPFIRRILT
jgi:hypothetical protein